MPARRQAFSQIESRYTPGRGREYIWQDDAACHGRESEFTFIELDDPAWRPGTKLNKQGKKVEVVGEKQVNRIRMEKAVVTCADCPVRQQCLDEASPAEKFWSIRGGRLPDVLVKTKNKAPVEYLGGFFEWECKNGHGRVYLAYRNKGGGQEGRRPYCLECAG